MMRLAIILLFLSASSMAADTTSLRCQAEHASSKEQLSPAFLEIVGKVCEKWQARFEKISWQLMNADYKKIQDASRKIISYEIGDLRNGRVLVKANTSSNGKQQQEIFWFRIKGFATVWSAKRDISANSVLARGDFIQQSVDVSTENLTQDQIVAEPAGMFVRKFLRKGATISTVNVSGPPLIQQNQEVQVLIENNGLQITAKGTALSTGWNVGDAITVLVNGASKRTDAIVAKRGWANVSI